TPEFAWVDDSSRPFRPGERRASVRCPPPGDGGQLAPHGNERPVDVPGGGAEDDGGKTAMVEQAGARADAAAPLGRRQHCFDGPLVRERPETEQRADMRVAP